MVDFDVFIEASRRPYFPVPYAPQKELPFPNRIERKDSPPFHLLEHSVRGDELSLIGFYEAYDGTRIDITMSGTRGGTPNWFGHVDDCFIASKLEARIAGDEYAREVIESIGTDEFRFYNGKFHSENTISPWATTPWTHTVFQKMRTIAGKLQIYDALHLTEAYAALIEKGLYFQKEVAAHMAVGPTDVHIEDLFAFRGDGNGGIVAIPGITYSAARNETLPARLRNADSSTTVKYGTTLTGELDTWSIHTSYPQLEDLLSVGMDAVFDEVRGTRERTTWKHAGINFRTLVWAFDFNIHNPNDYVEGTYESQFDESLKEAREIVKAKDPTYQPLISISDEQDLVKDDGRYYGPFTFYSFARFAAFEAIVASFVSNPLADVRNHFENARALLDRDPFHARRVWHFLDNYDGDAGATYHRIANDDPAYPIAEELNEAFWKKIDEENKRADEDFPAED